jgi:hypothetical protein
MDRIKNGIAFGKLRKVLESFGYSAQRVSSDLVAFHNHDRRLVVILPDTPPEQPVRPIDLLSVRNTLINDGVIRDGEEFDDLFRVKKGDRLIWTDPKTGRQVPVTAASGETRDGMVVIKQRGAFSACPLDQLREEDDVAHGAKNER